jgi:hypothetical protein
MPGLAVPFASGGHELAVAGPRSDGRVGHGLADLLSTAAGDGDLGNPLQRLLACGHVHDRESAEYRPSVTVPSVATTLTSSWSFSPPPNSHTPASLASWTTACAASATSGSSSAGKVIAPSSNEIRYFVIS